MAKILSLLSSGRDSMLTVCRIIESGNIAYMVHFDNGCISHPEYAEAVAQRIQKHYHTPVHKWIGNQSIMPIFQSLLAPYMQNTTATNAARYGHIPPYQLCCICCRTAMYIAAIAIAKKNNIKKIADGARFSQKFINQQPIVIDWYKNYFAEHDVELLTPVFNVKNDAEIIEELSLRGFHPKTMETKCWLGFPAVKDPTEEEIRDGVSYLQDIKPLIEKQFDHYWNILNTNL